MQTTSFSFGSLHSGFKDIGHKSTEGDFIRHLLGVYYNKAIRYVYLRCFLLPYWRHQTVYLSGWILYSKLNSSFIFRIFRHANFGHSMLTDYNHSPRKAPFCRSMRINRLRQRLDKGSEDDWASCAERPACKPFFRSCETGAGLHSPWTGQKE